MSYVVLFTAIAAGSAVIGFIPAYLIARRPVVDPLGSPPCDRCGKDTGKPWLWRQTRTPWRCTPCDAEVAELVFTGMREAYEQRAKQEEALLRTLAVPVRPGEETET
jgi:hypothetical protein